MKTLKDAERATELGTQRDRLISQANTIRMSDRIYFGSGEEARAWFPGSRNETPARFDVEVLGDKFRALVTEELKAQIAAIDAQLRKIGIEPDPFDAAAPEKPEADDEEDPKPLTIHVTEVKQKPVRTQLERYKAAKAALRKQ